MTQERPNHLPLATHLPPVNSSQEADPGACAPKPHPGASSGSWLILIVWSPFLVGKQIASLLLPNQGRQQVEKRPRPGFCLAWSRQAPGASPGPLYSACPPLLLPFSSQMLSWVFWRQLTWSGWCVTPEDGAEVQTQHCNLRNKTKQNTPVCVPEHLGQNDSDELLCTAEAG